MKIKTKVKASATTGNVGRAGSRNRTGLKVKTGIKAGRLQRQLGGLVLAIVLNKPQNLSH